MKRGLLHVLGVTVLVTSVVCFSSAATTSVVPTTGVSATNISSNSCSGQIWNCVNDPIGSPDSDTTYAYKVAGQTSGTHVIGFSGSISNITAVTMHIVAAVDSTDPNAAGTAQMILLKNGTVSGTGGVKTLTSTYTEYVSGVFTTSIASLSDVTMKVIFTNTGTSTGILKYTAAWLDVTYGGSGTALSDMDTHLKKFQNADGSNSGDFVWNDGTGYKSGSCTISSCSGGSGGTTLTVTAQLTPPATPPSPLSPLATEISVSGGNTGFPGALEWVKETPSTATDAAVSFQADWWAYLDATTSTPQTLEFDMFWGNTVHTAMFGSHCKFTSGTSCTWQEDPQDNNPSGWQDIIDAKTGLAISITLSKNAWHHITWQLHQDQNLGQIYYDYLTIDGTTYMIAYQSKVRGYKQTSNQFHTIGSQVQQDMNSLHEAFNEWIDGMSVIYW